jgi:hypothetical protein
MTLPDRPMPEPDPEWKRRFDAKMRDLDAWAERRRTSPEPDEP